MRKKEAQKYIERLCSEAKGSSSSSPNPNLYFYGVKEGCEKFLDWLIQQGVIKQ